MGSIIQSHDFPHEIITRRRRATTPRSIALRASIPIPYIRAHRIAILIVRLHFAMILQPPGRILTRVMDNPHLEGTTALDGAGLPLALMVCELAGVFHPACSCADVQAESAGGAVLSQSVAAFCGPVSQWDRSSSRVGNEASGGGIMRARGIVPVRGRVPGGYWC